MPEETVISEIEGVIDDTPKDDAAVVASAEKAQDEDRTKELVSGLQDQLNSVQAELKNAKSTKSERDEIVDRFAKAIGFIEGSGTGKYDATTGQIIKVEKPDSGPDKAVLLQDEIKKTEKELLKDFKAGNITQEEYYQELQESVAPLKDKLRDTKFEQRINKIKEELTPKKDIAKETVKDTVKEPTKDTEVYKEYDRLADIYPDITDKSSLLFKKMDEIYSKNSRLYANANYNGGKGDADQYRDLIERAQTALKADGIDIKKEKKSIRNQFAEPGNKGYQEPEKEEYSLNKNDLNMMVSQGITSKSLLNDTNKAVSSWAKTGNMVMDD